MELIDMLLKTFDTGSGVWQPLLWGITFVVALLLVYVVRMLGKKTYKQGTDQEKVFLSGNVTYDQEHMHIKAGNLYWGFMKSFDGIYQILRRMHNGDVNDYVLWFIAVLAIVLLLGVLL